jgi:peptidoglycan/xylan/chitin deacetylase (PgdA/CDA1 family)
MSRDDEREFLIAARDMVEEATGQRPLGYNANWLRRSPNMLLLLQELGYLYHIDDVSRDEPFIEPVNGKDFRRCPLYAAQQRRCPDWRTELRAGTIPGANWTSTSYTTKPAVGAGWCAHDRISGTPQMVKAWDAFLTYAKDRPGVAFLRKDAIARHVLQGPLTFRESETI